MLPNLLTSAESLASHRPGQDRWQSQTSILACESDMGGPAYNATEGK